MGLLLHMNLFLFSIEGFKTIKRRYELSVDNLKKGR